MKRNLIFRVFVSALLHLLFNTTGSSYAQINKAPLSQSAIDALKAKVELMPDSLKAHQAYLKAMGAENPELEKQYEIWMSKYPTSAIVPYAIGEFYKNMESPKAKPYLLKAVAINPKFTDAWGGLWTDGERWGDFTVSRGYLAKATESDPSNPNYAFYYASSFGGIDETKWKQMSLDVAKRFPDHERGAQALYWLGARSKKVADKLKYFELLHDSYDPAKYNWSGSGMSSYYTILLSENPQKAVALAQEMAKTEKEEKKTWPGMVIQAQTVLKAKTLIDQKKGAEALAVLKQLKLSRSSQFKTDLELLKAQAANLAGNTAGAYDSLIVAFAKSPSTSIRTAIANYGKKLGKKAEQTDADIWGRLNAIAQTATPFSGLRRYMTPGEASLADYKGKVVLLTYWFPGCGPCRGEFPHFENVVRKFKGKDLEYIGINIVSDQNDYVVPFMKSSGYSFTPLEEIKGRAKGNLDNGGAAPTNFLIDQQGRVVFSNFRTDGDNEEDLELMINLLLASKAL